mmetsp:Transcript_12250/g.30167  ORF Transcript_12250/g.30167 Transcript_12250/m.30167 type:complete len:233 (-) Transcript_12250:388-1086(-)
MEDRSGCHPDQRAPVRRVPARPDGHAHLCLRARHPRPPHRKLRLAGPPARPRQGRPRRLRPGEQDPRPHHHRGVRGQGPGSKVLPRDLEGRDPAVDVSDGPGVQPGRRHLLHRVPPQHLQGGRGSNPAVVHTDLRHRRRERNRDRRGLHPRQVHHRPERQDRQGLRAAPVPHLRRLPDRPRREGCVLGPGEGRPDRHPGERRPELLVGARRQSEREQGCRRIRPPLRRVRCR